MHYAPPPVHPFAPAPAAAAAAASSSAHAASSAASAAASALLPSLAPAALLPPLVSAYLPSVPPPSTVDLGRQRATDLSFLQAPGKDGQPPVSIQVRKRRPATDAIRLNARKKTVSRGGPAMIPHSQTGLQVRDMPDRVDISLPESGLLNQLLALEKRVDATIARRHVDAQQAMMTIKQPPQVLRLWLWHEHATPLTHEELMEGWAASDKPEAPGSWMLRIQGQILEASESANSSTAPATRCMSNYLSAMIVQIEGKPMAAAAGSAAAASSTSSSSASGTPTETIEWRKHSAVALSDGFEIRRRSGASTGSDVTMKISLFLDHSPARFRLSPVLSQVLNLPLHASNPLPSYASQTSPHPFPFLETSSGVLAAFWEYVKKNNLQQQHKPTIISCDAALASLFGVQELPVSSVLSFLQLHMSLASAEPIVIPYHIRPTLPAPSSPFAGLSNIDRPAPSPSQAVCYDILCYTPVLPNLALMAQEAMTYSGVKTVPPPSIVSSTSRATERLSEFLFELDKCNRRREFLTAFSEAPVQVMQMLIAQHAKDSLMMMGTTGVDDELERRAEYYHADWQHDAIDKYLVEQQQEQNGREAMQAME